MVDPIVLQASADENALVNAIQDATAQGAPLILGPGVHLTKPGRTNRIHISRYGLSIQSQHAEAPATIMRPSHAIDLTKPDDNHGLFFVPDEPGDDELAQIAWQQAPSDDVFQFGVIIRGTIRIEGIRIDCNMGQQSLETLPKNAAEHSCMMGFSGSAYPGGTKRTAYVGFRSVELVDIVTDNGGYADDIWFSRGGFYPNIVNVQVDRLVSTPRVINRDRATLDFSGLCQNITVTKSQLFELGMEDTAVPYRDLPRAAPVFQPSQWSLTDITMDKLDVAASGKVYDIHATGLTTSESCYIYQAGGVISDSTFRVGPNRRLIRENGLQFRNVAWILDPDENGVSPGLKPTAQQGDPCDVSFINNVFKVSGNVSQGEILNSEYTADAANRVQVTAIGCQYPLDFGYDSARPIARLEERGVWTFAARDLEDRDINLALPRRDTPEVQRIVT